ncbi:MAG: hypothetical protein SLRJCFUN_001184 [Candidatus Fervidibacter sp.]
MLRVGVGDVARKVACQGCTLPEEAQGRANFPMSLVFPTCPSSDLPSIWARQKPRPPNGALPEHPQLPLTEISSLEGVTEDGLPLRR